MGVLGRRWLQIFVSGLVLLYLVERTLVATSNLNFVPSVILLGAFLVLIIFLTYLYERLPNWDVPLPAIAVCFLWGGVLGTVVAGALEYDVARALGFLPKLSIGLIEESAKLIVPLVFYFIGRYRSEAAGIVLGVATAAGFAGLETMGYGFVSLLASRGNLGILDEVLLVRGLTSPAGHMAWTGLVCAVLWRERIRAGHATHDPPRRESVNEVSGIRFQELSRAGSSFAEGCSSEAEKNLTAEACSPKPRVEVRAAYATSQIAPHCVVESVSSWS